MRMMLLSLLLALTAPLALAETAEEKGLAIAREADRRDLGWQDSSAAMTMILRNAQGDESRRQLRVRNLEVEGDGDKTLTIFDEPLDVQGTAFLTFSHKTGPDDQWLFLPALARVKRIASRNKSGPFMGSEFAYEDISSDEVEKYRYKYLRDEVYEGMDCFVLERYPVDPHSGYTRQVVWIDQAEYRPQQVVYHDRKDALLKTLRFEGYRQYLDRYWRADRFRMVNHQTGKSTELHWSDFQFRQGLTERDFDQNSLRRAR